MFRANTCNPSYLGDRDQDHGSKPAWANSSRDPILKVPNTVPSTCLASVRSQVHTPVTPTPNLPKSCFVVKITVRWHGDFGTILTLSLFFSTDFEEWQCSGAVAHRPTLLLQCIYYWASPGAQCIEYSVLKMHCGVPLV
jgi:hypothetical protein